MEQVRQQAMICVGRAVAFGYFAIAMIMLGFIFDLVLFFRSGAVLAVLLALILLWFAQTAMDRDPKQTETWISLDQTVRPNNPHSVKFFRQTMKEVYAHFATWSLRISMALLGASIVFATLGVRYIFMI